MVSALNIPKKQKGPIAHNGVYEYSMAYDDGNDQNLTRGKQNSKIKA